MPAAICARNCLQPRCQEISNIKIYKSIILSFAVYGCENWSLTLRGGHRLRMSENRGIWV